MRIVTGAHASRKLNLLVTWHPDLVAVGRWKINMHAGPPVVEHRNLILILKSLCQCRSSRIFRIVPAAAYGLHRLVGGGHPL